MAKTSLENLIERMRAHIKTDGEIPPELIVDALEEIADAIDAD